jgi:hypothetical protein
MTTNKPTSLADAKRELQAHIDLCKQCQVAHGKTEMCSAGQSCYGRMLAAWIPGPGRTP